jgi:hypothetical protein
LEESAAYRAGQWRLTAHGDNWELLNWISGARTFEAQSGYRDAAKSRDFMVQYFATLQLGKRLLGQLCY